MASDVASGMWGDAPWTLCDGVLTVSRGVVAGWGTGAIGNSGGGSVANHPWNNASVKTIVLEPGVLLNSDSGWAFASMPNLEHIYGLDTIDVSYARSVWGLFKDDPKLQNLDFGSKNLIANAQSISQMFAGDTSLTHLDLSSFKVSQNYGANVGADSMFLDCSNLRSITGLNTMAPAGYGRINNLDSIFKGASSLTILDLSGFDASAVSNMADMFNGDVSLTSLNLDGFDTSNVHWMGRMFQGCASLANIPTEHFDTRNVQDMSSMFNGDNSLRSLDVSSFDTSNVGNMNHMFDLTSDPSRRSVLTSLDVSNFNLDNVSDASYMFAWAQSLKTLKMPQKMTRAALTNTSHMFEADGALESVDLSWMDVSRVTDMNRMFNGLESVKSLDLSSFDNSANRQAGAYMFIDMPALSRLTLGPKTYLASNAFDNDGTAPHATEPKLDDTYSGEWVQVSDKANKRVFCSDAGDNIYQLKNAAWSSCNADDGSGQGASRALADHAAEVPQSAGTYVWGQRATVRMKNVNPKDDTDVAVDHVYGLKVNNAVVYNGSGTASAVSIDNFKDYTVANAPDHNESDYVFHGWNTEEDGTGVTYQPGDTIALNAGLTRLYAIWQKVTTPTNGGNAGDGGATPGNGGGNGSGTIPSDGAGNGGSGANPGSGNGGSGSNAGNGGSNGSGSQNHDGNTNGNNGPAAPVPGAANGNTIQAGGQLPAPLALPAPIVPVAAAVPLRAAGLPGVASNPVNPANPPAGSRDNGIPAPTTPRNRAKECVSGTEQSAYPASWLEPTASAAPLCNEPSSTVAHTQFAQVNWWWIVLISALAILMMLAYWRYQAQSEIISHHRGEDE